MIRQILTVLGFAYVLVWFLFFAYEIPTSIELYKAAPIEAHRGRLYRASVLVLYFVLDAGLAFFWPLILAKGPAYVIRAMPWVPDEDAPEDAPEDEEDES